MKLASCSRQLKHVSRVLSGRTQQFQVLNQPFVEWTILYKVSMLIRICSFSRFSRPAKRCDAQTTLPEYEGVNLNFTGSSTCENCTNKPTNAAFSFGYTGQTSNSCPWNCSTGFYPDNRSQSRQSCQGCTNAPSHAVYSGPGTALGACPWQCVAGFFLNVSQTERCTACPVGTYSSVSGAEEYNKY